MAEETHQFSIALCLMSDDGELLPFHAITIEAHDVDEAISKGRPALLADTFLSEPTWFQVSIYGIAIHSEPVADQ